MSALYWIEFVGIMLVGTALCVAVSIVIALSVSKVLTIFGEEAASSLPR